MHVISKVKLREFWIQHTDSEDALNDWYKFASIAKWSNLVDVQKRYPKAEAVGNFTVFNIKGIEEEFRSQNSESRRSFAERLPLGEDSLSATLSVGDSDRAGIVRACIS